MRSQAEHATRQRAATCAVALLACALARPPLAAQARVDDAYLVEMRGSVRAADGSPPEGAELVLERVSAMRTVRHRARCDARGRYRVRFLPGFEYRVFAWARRGETLLMSRTRRVYGQGRLGPLTLLFEVPEPRIVLEQLGNWKHRGVAPRLVDEAMEALTQRDDGSWRLPVAATRTRELHALAPDGWPLASRELRLEAELVVRAQALATQRLAVTLGSKHKRSVRAVFAPSGATRRGARDGLSYPFESAPPGEAPIPRVMLYGRGCLRSAVSARAGAALAQPRGRALAGRVTRSGRASAGRPLMLSADMHFRRGASAHALTPELRVSEAGGAFAFEGIGGEDGHTLFCALREDERADLEDNANVAPWAVVRTSKRRGSDLAIELAELVTLRLELRDSAGGPASRAAVCVLNGDSSASTQRPAYFRADRRGLLAIRVMPGCVLGIAVGSEHGFAIARQRVAREMRLRLTLTPPITVRGRFVDKAGHPVPGLRLRAVDSSIGGLLGNRPLVESLPLVPGETSDSDGRFLVRVPGAQTALRFHVEGDDLVHGSSRQVLGIGLWGRRKFIQVGETLESRRDVELSLEDVY